MWLFEGLLSTWSFFSALEATILRLPCSKYANFKVSHHNKMLRGYVIKSETVMNDLQCMVKCMELSKCQSYNIKIDAGICQLNSESERGNSTKLSNAPSWLYKSTDFDDKLIGFTCNRLRPCHNVKCVDTCIPPYFQCIDCDRKNDGHYCAKREGENSCAKNPCKNGTCVKTVSGYECSCSPGYFGKHCENDIDKCFSLPCFNGGKCINLIGKFRCNCLPGYKGVNCAEEVDECQSSPCKNNGTCHDLINGYRCQCLKGFFGKNCQIIPNSCKYLKLMDPALPTGFYSIDGTSAGVGTLVVFCDMETDRGGWTQVLNVSSTTDNFNSFRADQLKYIHNLDGFKANKKYGMTSSALKVLKTITGYKQFRFKCKKKGGSNLLHIKTKYNSKGLHVTECLTTSSYSLTFEIPSCDTYVRLPDDISQIGQNCGKWKWENRLGQSSWLMNHLMYIPHTAHWNIGFDLTRYECDTFEWSRISSGDFWEVFVR